MHKKELPSQDRLSQLLDYDAETGLLAWRARPIEMFSPVNGRTASNCMAVWNAKYAGREAGCRKIYIGIKIEGQFYVAHRVIWKMMTGMEPDEIDHIDRDKHNNKWANLRDVGHSVNMRNKPLNRLNTSGHKHIFWLRRINRWTVQFSLPGKGQRQIAWLPTLEEAVAVRDEAYAKYGFDIRTDAK